MANPSTTGLSGAGTEVLRRSYIDEAGESESTIITGVANHIMTVLSIIIYDRGSLADNNFSMYIDYDLGGTNLYLCSGQKCGSNGTFVWSDSLVLTETDKLHFLGASASGTANFDVWCSYRDIDFT